jgi:hypothetical protein
MVELARPKSFFDLSILGREHCRVRTPEEQPEELSAPKIE